MSAEPIANLKPQVRILLGLASLPGLVILAFWTVSLVLSSTEGFDPFSFGYGLLSLYIASVALSGRTPGFMRGNDDAGS